MFMFFVILLSSGNSTQVCRFSNCKLTVQSKLGLQRLTQLGYLNVHRWGVMMKEGIGLRLKIIDVISTNLTSIRCVYKEKIVKKRLITWNYFQSLFKVTQGCRFWNCKLAAQFKLGLQRLAQLGYLNVHRYCACIRYS